MNATPPAGEKRRPELVPLGAGDGTRFDEAFGRELLLSEQLRAKILAQVFIAGFVAAALMLVYVKVYDVPLLSERYSGRLVLSVLLGLILYERVAYHLIRHWIRRSIAPRAWWRYGNAFVEVSTPTVLFILLFRTFEDPVEVLLTPAPFIYFIFIILSTLRLRFSLCLFTGVVAAVEYGAVAFYALRDLPLGGSIETILYSHVVYVQKALILVLSGVAAGFVAHEIRRRVHTSFLMLEERDRVKRVFGQHTSPAIVKELLGAHGGVQSRRQHVCIMFVDIRGFTAFAEQREPEEVVRYLNTLFDLMIDIVNRRHGIIHQLLGDGFMAIFGAPTSAGNDCQHAVDAALTILERLEAEQAAGRIPPTRLGIGLHAGEVVAGTVGSAVHREYKVTGDVVNLASRIEQLNKRFETQCLISEAVREAVTLNGHPVVERGAIPVRGRQEPVRLFELA